MKKIGEIKMKINKKNSFALLYAILIMFLFMITVSAVMFSALADIRQYKKAKSSLGAWMAAQSGIEAGLASYKSKPSVDTCGNPTHVPMDTDPLKRYYIVEICPPILPNSSYIQSTGVYDGVKMKLQADNIDNISPNYIKIYQVGI